MFITFATLLKNILKTNKLERTKVLPEELPLLPVFYVLSPNAKSGIHFLHNFKALVCLTID